MIARSIDQLTRTHFDVSDDMSRKVLASGLAGATHIYAFDTASLLVMRATRGSIVSVMEQTNAPREVISSLLAAERAKHAGWESPGAAGTMDDAIRARYHEAWALADVILCGSQFVLDGIRSVGGPVEKCEVVPYGVDFNDAELKDENWRETTAKERWVRRRDGLPLRVLSIGTVSLRKGAPYVLAAAQALGAGAHFRVVGAIEVSRWAAARMAGALELVGLVPRDETRELYRWADVFLLPSVCEGSATATYEALVHGLPVICTPNTGSVIRHRIDGLCVAPCSAEPVIEALSEIRADPDFYLAMVIEAFRSSDGNDVAHYGQRLLHAVGVPGSGTPPKE